MSAQGTAGPVPAGRGETATVLAWVRFPRLFFLGMAGLGSARRGAAWPGADFNSDGLIGGSTPPAVLRQVRSRQVSAGLGVAR